MSGGAGAAGPDDPFLNDDSIPLLTEVVPLRRPGAEAPPATRQDNALPPGQPDQSPATARTASPAPPLASAIAPAMVTAPAAASATPVAASTTSLTQADWDALAERIERGVTGRMLAQAGPMLENSLQTLVAPLIEQAAVQIAHDLHDVFSHLVQDLVARAVAEELALLQARDDAPAPPESH